MRPCSGLELVRVEPVELSALSHHHHHEHPAVMGGDADVDSAVRECAGAADQQELQQKAACASARVGGGEQDLVEPFVIDPGPVGCERIGSVA